MKNETESQSAMPNSQFVRIEVDNGDHWPHSVAGIQPALVHFANHRFREAAQIYTQSDPGLKSRVLVAPFVDPIDAGKVLWSRPSMALPVGDAFPGCFMELAPNKSIPSELSYLIELEDVIITPNQLIVTKEGNLIRQGVSHLIPTAPQVFHSQVYPEVKLSGPGHVLMTLTDSARVIDTPCLFFTAGDTQDCGRSYYHWLIDYLSRMAIYHRFPELNEYPMICYQGLLPYQSRSLELAGIPEQRLLRKKPHESLFCRKLYVASSASFPAVIYPEAVEFLRNALQSHVAPISGPERIYISRRKNPIRNIVNEEAIEQMLSQKGFCVIDPSELDFDTEIATFANAGIIAGPSGAGLVNAAFARPGAAMIDIMTDPNVNHFSTLAAAAGLSYHNLMASPVDPQPDNSSAARQYVLSVDKLELLVNYLDLLSMMPGRPMAN